MFQISTMANFETEVYELLKLFDSAGDKYDKKISSSLCTDPPPGFLLKEWSSVHWLQSKLGDFISTIGKQR